jgi:hypothetical protein
MRRSRHHYRDNGVVIRATERSLGTLQLFDTFRLLPLNYMHALAGGGNYCGYRDLCTRMTWAGLLERKTLNGTFNNNETQTYFRTDAGDRFLHEKGFEALPHDSHHDTHQVLTDVAEAQIVLGARGSDIQYHSWKEIRDHPKTPPLPPKPFRFDLEGTYQIPDGRPFFLKNNRGAALFIREIDRSTEAKDTIRIKLQHYRLLEETIKRRYGFKALFLLFITTDTTRQQNILALIEELWPDGCKWILTQTMEDHIKSLRTTPALSMHLFKEPYQRAGHRPFSLQTLSEV